MLHSYSLRCVTREQRLEAENRQLRADVAALADRLAALQTANEGAYRELTLATGGPAFDVTQPFGSEPKRPLGSLFLKGRDR